MDYDEFTDWLADMRSAAEDILIAALCIVALLAAISPAFA